MIDAFSNYRVAPTADPLRTTLPSAEERIATLRLHVESNDYFLHLLTVLGFFEETLVADQCPAELVQSQVQAIRAMREDLRYLQEHYRIEPRF